MTWQQVLNDFANDNMLKAIALLIVVDVVLGVIDAAASKTQRFDFQRTTDFLVDDVVGKVLPWFVLYSAAKFGPDVSVLGHGDVLNDVQVGASAVVVVALLASLATSLSDFGFASVLGKLPGVGPDRADRSTGD